MDIDAAGLLDWFGLNHALLAVIGKIGLGVILGTGFLLLAIFMPVAVTVFAPSARRICFEIAIGCLICTAVYGKGISDQAAVSQEANLRAELVQIKLEKKTAEDLRLSAEQTLAEIRAKRAEDEEKINDLQKRIDLAEKAGKPDPDAVYDAQCRVTPAGVRDYWRRKR